MPGGWELVATLGIVLIAGVIVGLAGFGFALFAVPPLLFFQEPSTVVVLVNFLGFTSGIAVVYAESHQVRLPTLRELVPWAIVGLIAGTAVLRSVEGIYIKLLASVVVVVFAIVAAAGITLPGAQRPGATIVAGLVSGALGTSAGLPGPPIALLFTARELPPAAFRVTITSYFMIVDLIAIALLAVSGQIGRSDMVLSVGMLPAALAGRWVGWRLTRRISPVSFRRIVIGLLLLTGASGAVGAVVSLT
ncbi:MAG: sulfite exporter TauE/SafE family protein [Thermomicrobiales bacterium]|nr:sulfite exporter TauE/SafE family protein [Thermomicrobiales bacterium]